MASIRRSMVDGTVSPLGGGAAHEQLMDSQAGIASGDVPEEESTWSTAARDSRHGPATPAAAAGPANAKGGRS
ncbi:hypothetical protein ACGF07_03880 [Kitasatospora sp. NPDC048194]|uniref:hypothetical protein n=1 Tax=Kitasatospora sp. NPDC048194 TaxID=3364045 RepID=UPI003721BAE1